LPPPKKKGKKKLCCQVAARASGSSAEAQSSVKDARRHPLELPSDIPDTVGGIKVRRVTKKKGAAAVAKPAGRKLDKPVVNCLCCGKVYDCRNVTGDVMRFLGAR
jgi:hypothetical protein